MAELSGIRTSFQMIHLKNFANQYNYLSGLLSLFDSKITMKSSTPIGITAHFFYNMKVWHPDYTFQTKFQDIMEHLKAENPSEAESGSTSMSSWKEHLAFTNLVPFGCSDDPFESMRLVVGWPSLSEDVVRFDLNLSQHAF